MVGVQKAVNKLKRPHFNRSLSLPDWRRAAGYRGEECVQIFEKSLSERINEIQGIDTTGTKEMNPLSSDQEIEHSRAIRCHICTDVLSGTSARSRPQRRRAQRGSSFYRNLLLRACAFIPFLFHNLTGYDCHLFAKELSESDGRIEDEHGIVLPFDDASLLLKVSRQQPDFDEGNSTIPEVVEWCTINDLLLNENNKLVDAKAVARDETVDIVDTTPFFGLTLDNVHIMKMGRIQEMRLKKHNTNTEIYKSSSRTPRRRPYAVNENSILSTT
ncbi:hypothetical protein EVAR_13797_1 [Eumeta japonica]|uniref:Uncharacterized protein n=1 Tax=Eumeta variegata TaxID=151549 RepID=A0A4C1U106_EUMVA|nr:hypothetical protein EVAR_13797_1 [Eumeta japonica]